jgi:protease-4
MGLCLGLMFLLCGCGTPSFLITPVAGDYKLHETVVKDDTGTGKILMIPVDGVLADVKTGGILQAQENPLSLFVEQLDEAAEDDSIKAVVLRVNSPGGSVTTSDTMYDAVMRFKAKTHKPVVADALEVDASGAYYLSCSADKIMVDPTSVVGSIGVIFETFDVADTLQKIGVQPYAIKSAALKDMGSPFKHMTDQEKDIMQGMVNEYYARFKSVVTSHRTIKSDDFTMVTDGRVFSGTRAVELGLADQTGRLEDAIDLARQLGNAPNAPVIMYQRPYSYTGSIYASAQLPAPQAQAPASNELTLKLPMDQSFLPTGFYYLWRP